MSETLSGHCRKSSCRPSLSLILGDSRYFINLALPFEDKMEALPESPSCGDAEAVENTSLTGQPKVVAEEAQSTRNSHSYQQEVYREVLKRLTEAGCEAVNLPNFAEELLAHFTRLSNSRYALDVNMDRAEDVLLHKRLLQRAEVPENRPVFYVRPMPVLPTGWKGGEELPQLSALVASQEHAVTLSENSIPKNGHDSSEYAPAFGKLESLSIDGCNSLVVNEVGGSSGEKFLSSSMVHYPVHEVIFSTIDKTKLLSQLSALLADIGLNIREAHVFSTIDGYSLDVFVVDGWHVEDTEDLEHALRNAIDSIEKGAWVRVSPSSSPIELFSRSKDALGARPPDLGDDWELDGNLLKLEQKVASGSFGDLYRGTYCGQDVAIKVLKHDNLSDDLEQEFSQEVFILRKVRHKNVVQFIGACTKAPHFCIVTEFMARGSLYDYLHKQKSGLKLPMLLRVALDVAKGMDYLHQNNIIHRDLKAANLLLDENGVVKVADFGVARFQSQSGAMTAETGTYRWMAPEVISHLPYGHKADVFSFGIVLWELLTGKLPYESMNPVQAAIGVRQGLRPKIPDQTPPKLSTLIERCWQAEPSERPDFCDISLVLQNLITEVGENEQRQREKRPKSVLGSLSRGS